MIGGDFDTPIMYQDLANSSLGTMPYTTGIPPAMYGYGMGGMAGGSSYLGGVQMRQQPDRDKIEIMHKKENVGQVELATISFGQSFQITPIQLATTVSALVNGGRRVTPHFGMEVLSAEGKKVKTFRYNAKKHIVSEKTSQTMRELLESVVAEGSGKNAYVEGYRIGGKTATSQTLPRSANKYISSFVGFAPADDPQILGMCVIYNPQGVYYGGTIAAPVIGKIFENILPYLGIEKQ